MKLDKWTVCACVSCGWPAVGAHDCDRQLAENEPLDNFERVVFLTARGQLIAQLALAKARR